MLRACVKAYSSRANYVMSGMSVYIDAQAFSASLKRPHILSANKYYYYYYRMKVFSAIANKAYLHVPWSSSKSLV